MKTFKTLKVNQQNINSLVSEMHNYWQVKSFKNISGDILETRMIEK